MGRKIKTDRRPQTSRGRDVSLKVRQVQELRRSSASGPVPSRAKYDRNAFRKNDQRGKYED